MLVTQQQRAHTSQNIHTHTLPTPNHPHWPNQQAINRTCGVIECQQAKVPLDRILGLQSFDLEKILDMDPAFLKVARC